MKKLICREAGVWIGILLLLSIPAAVHAQAQSPPPIGTPLVREGDFAIKLESALGVGATTDEVEAETRLAEVGITPRNGWIADYPVTPDIIGELQKSVSDAADAGKLTMGKAEALKGLDDVTAQVGLPVVPYAGTPGQGKPPASSNYPDPTVINNYYYTSGPPVVTCYTPPPDFYYLYVWVPFPFWWYDFWFPGFFILHDFHRVFFIHNRVVHISNHFNDVRVHRVFRVDPVSRFRGRTFAGIGAPRSRNFISTGIQGSERRIFNGPRGFAAPGGRMASPPLRGGRIGAPPARGTERGGERFGPPVRGRQTGGERSAPRSPGGGGFERGRGR